MLERVKVASFRIHVSRPTLKIRHRRGIHGLSVSDAAAVGKLSIIDYLPSPPLLKAVSTAGPLFSPGRTGRQSQRFAGGEHVADGDVGAGCRSHQQVPRQTVNTQEAPPLRTISDMSGLSSQHQARSQTQPSPLHYRHERADARHRRRAVRVAIAGGL